MDVPTATAGPLPTSQHPHEGLLVLVIDTNPLQWFPSIDGSRNDTGVGEGAFQQLISSTLVFVNSYLLLHRSNRVVVIAAHGGSSEILYPNPDQDDTTGAAEQASKVNEQVINRLRELNVRGEKSKKSNDSAIAASLSRALCFINRAMNDEMELHPRILVLQKSADVPHQYISMMNAIFSAQKKSVAVDACILGHEPSSFLQQATYLTGGVYYKPSNQSALLQYLISIYLPDPSTRQLLKLPAQDSVDFRAMCFCHKRVVSAAYVCPVCLSLFCEFKPICSTCGIRSRIQPNKQLNAPTKKQRTR